MTDAVKKILHIFEEISAIPRCSKNEEAIGTWLINWAKENNFEVETDKVRNVLIRVPASEGYENAPVLVFQGHMDMVCEKAADSNHNFCTDPIKFVYDGDWLKADKTTLGADNGIALAMSLALAIDKEIKHPALELLFTVDEETGLTGASALEKDFLKGKVLINIDSEDEGVFFIGCAGGKDTKIELTMDMEDLPEEAKVVKITVGGMFGGHSGLDINKNRANANKVLARLLKILYDKFGVSLAAINGGTAHNAIPRQAEAVVTVNNSLFGEFQEVMKDFEEIIQKEYKATEKNIFVKFEDAKSEQVATKKSTKKAIYFMMSMPNGVAAMSADIKDLVETSNNFAIVKMEEGKLKILSSQRSSVMSRLEALTQRLEALALLSGAEVRSGNGYPAWQPNIDSALLKKCQDIYKELFDKDAKVEAIHAGLECGLIGAKYEGMDMISMGPDIRDPHSPDEKLYLPSIDKVWRFLAALVESYK